MEGLHRFTSLQASISRLLLYAGIVLGYGLLSLASNALISPALPALSFWLPTGLALALLIRQGGHVLPAIAIAALLVAWLDMSTSQTSASLQTGLQQALIHTLEPWLGWRFFRYNCATCNPVTHQTAFFRFVGAVTLASLTGTGLTISLASSSLNLPLIPLGNLLMHHWLSSVLAVLIIALPCLNGLRPGFFQHLRQHGWEWLLWGSGLLLITLTSRMANTHTIYLLLPLLLWATARLGMSGSLIAISLATLAAQFSVYGVIKAQPVTEVEQLLLQTLLLVMTASAIYIRITLEQRRISEAQLEHVVDERTRALQLRNQELRDEILVREQAERSFRRTSHQYRALIETAVNPIIVIDDACKIRQWNTAAEQLYGYGRDTVLGLHFLKAFTPSEYHDELAWKITKVLGSGIPKECMETEVSSFDCTRHTLLWNISRLNDAEEGEDGEAAQVILVGQEISEIRAAQNHLHYLAHHDALTDTANRRLFEDRCHQAIASAIRHQHSCALISLDVDHFKQINDSLGHDAGDILLRQMAERLALCIRQEDTLCRLGGDEFAILLCNVSGAEGCEKVARNALIDITRPFILPSGGSINITTSLGIALAPEDGHTCDTLLKHADIALYRAKQAGRNTYAFFSAEMNEEMHRQQALEKDLCIALKDGGLELYYQPVVDLTNNRVVALEALLRWNHPELGLLTPDRFLPAADQSGQILQLAEWVCYNTCLQARAIHAMADYPLQLHINVTDRQYRHPQLLPLLEKTLRETHVDPQYISLEIDECTLMHEGADLLLEKLHSMSIQLVLDRFGSGYSSVRHLSQLSFHATKIDRSLLNRVPEDPEATAIYSTLIRIAQQLSPNVIASGVETDAQIHWLYEMGCHGAQGFRYAHPIAADKLGEFFATLKTRMERRPNPGIPSAALAAPQASQETPDTSF